MYANSRSRKRTWILIYKRYKKTKEKNLKALMKSMEKLHNPVYFLDIKIINVRNCDNKNVNSTISA